jgi:hypothetical protein
VGAAQWHWVKDLFTSALERAAGEREAFLEEACAGDKITAGGG